MALLKTHSFKEAFAAGEAGAYVVNLKSHEASRCGLSLLRQKYNDQTTCVFVFQSFEAAENERKCFPGTLGLEILEVNCSSLRAALAASPGIPTVVFIRNNSGDYAQL